MQSKSSLMQEIEKNSERKKTESVSAIIIDNTIIPGLNGLEVDKTSSFSKMKTLGVFNDYYLVYKEIEPEISLENNKDKIIIRGNKAKKSIAFIFDGENNLTEYLKGKNIPANILVNVNNYLKSNYFELINNEVEHFDTLERLLNNNNSNKNICVLNEKNYDICLKNAKYLVKPTYDINNQTIISYKSNIASGDILLINSNISLENLKILIKDIQYRDLKLVNLSEIISENNNGE